MVFLIIFTLKLIVFVEEKFKINDEHKAMAALLRKFSIDSSDVHMIEGFDDPPEQETYFVH